MPKLCPPSEYDDIEDFGFSLMQTPDGKPHSILMFRSKRQMRVWAESYCKKTGESPSKCVVDIYGNFWL